MESSLVNKKCQVCEGGIPALTAEEIQTYLKSLHEDWQVSKDHKVITRVFTFKGYYKTIAFVNALAWIAQTEGHHPDLMVNYGKVTVHFSTHAIDGLTENDFICASKADLLLV